MTSKFCSITSTARSVSMPAGVPMPVYASRAHPLAVLATASPGGKPEAALLGIATTDPAHTAHADWLSGHRV